MLVWVQIPSPVHIRIFIIMACHYLQFKNNQEFIKAMKDRDPDLIVKMTKCVISAVKRGKPQIDIFDITFKDMSSLLFSIDKSQYNELLKNCMNDLIAIEEYELCAEIKKILDKKTRRKKTEVL